MRSVSLASLNCFLFILKLWIFRPFRAIKLCLAWHIVVCDSFSNFPFLGLVCNNNM